MATKRKSAPRTLGSPSRTTGNKPSARLMARRAKDTIKGYYPNPRKAKVYRVCIGKYSSSDAAEKAAMSVSKKLGVGVSVVSE